MAPAKSLPREEQLELFSRWVRGNCKFAAMELPEGASIEPSQGDGWIIRTPHGYIDYRHDEAENINELHLRDAISGIESTFLLDKPAKLWSYPLETISASEEGFERNYQQTVLLPCWPIKLIDSWQVKFTLEVKSLG